MERNMEASVDMLQEEARITQHSTKSQRAQDRRIRRLQWAVTGCWISMFALLCLTVYQMLGNSTSPKPDKVESFAHINGPPQNLNKTVKKPRAHLRATNQSTTKTKDTYLLWESQNGLAFAKDGMKFDNQSIQIPSMGYYFVYCQVSLKFSSSSKDNYFEARIVKVNGNYPAPEDLFKGKVHRDTQNTIYMAGLLFLIRGDKLKVNVTDVNQVDNSSEHTTYFGAFWVMDGKSS